MKKKLSISIEERTIDMLSILVEQGDFRNKSHLVESAINKFIKEKKNAR
jgi:Arc/MetJ-type ribon-helix-helix transcriptional regulator